MPALPDDSAISYGLVAAAVFAAGRSHRRRFADLLLAATAHARGLDLLTRNPDDFTGFQGLVRIIAV